jgi:cyclophilin family peptidyl-prolyl cis-trans isomerase
MTALRTFALFSTAALACTLAACNSSKNSDSSDSSASPAPSGAASAAAIPNGPRISIVTSQGTIVVALDPEHAPKTVANYLHYVDKGFFNGGTFFRAIPGFVIQGGNKAKEQPTDPKVELEDPVKTGLQNRDGSIAMARTQDPNSATSEFYIDDGDQPSLDGSMQQPGYAAFGQVVSGMDIVRKIAKLPAQGEMLVKPVQIIRITRVKK